VEAMILHATSIAAFFVDQLAQAPVQIQCVQQSAPESWLKQWIPTAVSLLSIGIGVWIARWSFRASSERDRERWVLDQKKTEWSLLLRSVASVYQITDLLNGWNRKIADRIVSELEPALKEVSIARANCVFLGKFRLNNEGGRKIREFLRSAEMQSQKIRSELGLFDSIEDRTEKAGSRTEEDNKSLLRCIEVTSGELSNLAEQSYNLLVWLQNEAALDLVVTAKGE
jgi:hypothetical protein